MKNTNKILISLGVITTCTFLTLMGNESVLRTLGQTNATPYTISLTDAHTVTESEEFTNASYTIKEGIYLNFSSVKDAAEGVCVLDSGSTITKSDISKGLTSVSATFDGSLKVETRYDGETSYTHYGVLTSGVELTINGDYFKITAESETTLHSLSITYNCNVVNSDTTANIASFDNYRIEQIEQGENNKLIYVLTATADGILKSSDVVLCNDNPEVDYDTISFIQNYNTLQLEAKYHLVDFTTGLDGDTGFYKASDYWGRLKIRGSYYNGTNGEIPYSASEDTHVIIGDYLYQTIKPSYSWGDTNIAAIRCTYYKDQFRFNNLNSQVKADLFSCNIQTEGEKVYFHVAAWMHEDLALKFTNQDLNNLKLYIYEYGTGLDQSFCASEAAEISYNTHAPIVSAAFNDPNWVPDPSGYQILDGSTSDSCPYADWNAGGGYRVRLKFDITDKIEKLNTGYHINVRYYGHTIGGDNLVHYGVPNLYNNGAFTQWDGHYVTTTLNSDLYRLHFNQDGTMLLERRSA